MQIKQSDNLIKKKKNNQYAVQKKEYVAFIHGYSLPSAVNHIVPNYKKYLSNR